MLPLLGEKEKEDELTGSKRKKIVGERKETVCPVCLVKRNETEGEEKKAEKWALKTYNKKSPPFQVPKCVWQF